MEEWIIAVGLGIFALVYSGSCILWMTNDLEKKIKEQRIDIKRLRKEVNQNE